MDPNWYLFILLAILFLGLGLLTYRYRNELRENKKKWYWHYPERFCFYSGLTYIYRKFIPKEKDVPATGWIWLVGTVYFAMYAFTLGRYENKLDDINFRYNTFTAQVLKGVESFKNERLMKILNTEIPVQPKILEPYSVFRSFFTKSNLDSKVGYSEKFFQSYNYASAFDFRQEIINQLTMKLNEAHFINAEFDRADFVCTNLNGALFWNAKLEWANFGSAKLNGTNFWSANLDNAIFINADLYSADFTKAKLDGANFANAKFLTAKQLIIAESIYDIKNCPSNVLEDIKKLGCEEMLKKRPDDWSDAFKEHRKKLIEQWKEQQQSSSSS